jgi:hypothetical protein
MTRLLSLAVVFASALPAAAADWPKVGNVELQPLAAQANRVAEALDFLGAPLPAADRAALKEAQRPAAIQEVLDKHCLAGVVIDGNKLTVVPGPARPELAEQGWRVFLVKVANRPGVSGVRLRADSPNALPMSVRSSSSPVPKVVSLGDVGQRFLELMMHDSQPLVADLSGLELEYRILQVYARDAGRKPAQLGFQLVKAGLPARRTDRPQQQAAVVARGEPVSFVFECRPAVLVKLRVRDHDGKPATGSFVLRDPTGRVYPAMSRRLAPDFPFHPQIYRADGETVVLQPGRYTVNYARGPEYLLLQREITVPEASTHEESFELRRWIHPAKRGWYSGDHHVHAAGCSHYESPTEGVTPEDMMRHILGEDLNVGCCLSWGPCWYHQKRYFEGRPHRLSQPNHILRYDVEVSGFPSSHCGHICLLRLREQDYPGTKLIEDWPSWDLPIFKWAKGQGGVVGFAHSGWGLDAGPTRELPNYIVPPMSGIGANEYVMDVTHGMCDFISTVDTPPVWELNIWYHTLNCGYRCRISGETDFPCIYGERVGLGRSYVHLAKGLNFDDWAEGIKRGRCYVSDGKSHLMDFAVNGTGVGLNNSEVRLEKSGPVQVKALVAALLEPKPTAETEQIRKTPLTGKPYWDVERARVGDTRSVPVELIVNGRPVATKEVVADGTAQEVTFETPIEASSWVCLRIFPSSHTNPVFVLVGDKPVRASRRSADWCLQAVDQCWKQKVKLIRERERPEAERAYDHARAEYRRIREESAVD